MNNTLRALIVLAALPVVAACVDHRPIRNGLRDESIYLTKSDLTNPNPKLLPEVEDTGWLVKVTTVRASSPNVVGDYVFPGLESGIKYVRFRFRENALQLVDGARLQTDDPDDPNDDLGTSTERVMYEFKGEHVDVKLRESLDGERTNWLEENSEEPWQKRQKFKVNFEETSIDPVHFMWWGYADYIADCAALLSTHLVPDSFEWDGDDQYMAFTIEANYRLKSITGFGGCWDLVTLATDATTGTVHYKFSFYRRGPSSYVPEVIDEKDVVNKRFGAFQTVGYNPTNSIFQDETTGLLGAKSFIIRANPNRPSDDPWTFYFAEGFPEKFKPMFGTIAAETNRVLQESGATLRVTFVNKPPEISYGDVRHSFVAWHQDIGTTKGLLGYGPPGADPRTGEIISSTLNLYNIGMDYYRYFIQDYLEEFGGLSKPDPNLPWEQIACNRGDTVAPANHGGRLQAPVFNEMRRIMQLPETPTNPIQPEDDFIPTPQRDFDLFMEDYQRILPEYRYAVYWWNAYTYKGGGDHPLGTFKERLQIEREYQDAMNSILLGENPFGMVGLATREGIEAQLAFIEQFREWRKNHEQFLIDRNMIWRTRTVYEFDAGDAFEAVSRGARFCDDDGFWESDAEYTDRMIEQIVSHTAIHEFGHNLTLRHNFYGSIDALNFRPGEITSSVMDYVSPVEDAGSPFQWGAYDEAALKWVYGTQATRDQVMGESYLYCTDEHSHFSPLCAAFDLGITPSQIVMNAIERNDWMYEVRNRRAYRKFWDTSYYPNYPYNAIFPLQRMWYLGIFDWGGGGVGETLKRLDQVEGRPVGTPQEYNERGVDLTNDVAAAIGMTMAYYDAVINQSASYRNYQSEYDPYYGDLLRMGIVLDKIYAMFAFMDLQEVWNYNPNIYTYVSMYDYPFGNENYAISQRVLDDMLGASYDTFPWFQYYALLVFANATNSNLVDTLSLRQRIAIERYDNMMEFEEIYGPDALTEAFVPDNPAQLFTHEGEVYVYTYLQDRNWHLVANKSRNTVSFQYIKDYNESLNAGASTSLDTYGLKILLAYYEYFNNFQGF